MRSDYARTRLPADPTPSITDPSAAGSWLPDEGPFLSALIDVLPSMVWAATVGVGMDYLSHRWVEFTGQPLPRLMGRGYFELVHPDDLPALVERSNNARPGNEVVSRFRLRRHDGQWRWMEARHRVLKAADGTLRAVGATTDITGQVHAEQEVQRRTDLLAQTMELGGMGGFVWQLSPQGIPLAAEPLGALLEILGVTIEQAHAEDGISKALDVTHPDDHPLVRTEIARAVDPEIGEFRLDHRILRPQDDEGLEERWVSVLARVQFDERRRPQEMLGVMQDITDRRRAEQARLQLQKSEAIATLAGGVAHDFGNIVGAIRNAATVARAEASAGHSTEQTLSEIAAAAARAVELVERLVGFATPTEPRAELVNVGEVIDEVVRLTRAAFPHDLAISFEPKGAAPVIVSCDSGQLHQVLLNLVTNAAQAIGEARGTIRVRLDTVDTSDGVAARIRVDDDGPGIAPGALARVFDPFFTTRGASGGTGLGLAAVQTIVAAHRGTVDVVSPADGGTTFTVLLPVAADGSVGTLRG